MAPKLVNGELVAEQSAYRAVFDEAGLHFEGQALLAAEPERATSAGSVAVQIWLEGDTGFADHIAAVNISRRAAVNRPAVSDTCSAA